MRMRIHSTSSIKYEFQNIFYLIIWRILSPFWNLEHGQKYTYFRIFTQSALNALPFDEEVPVFGMRHFLFTQNITESRSESLAHICVASRLYSPSVGSLPLGIVCVLKISAIVDRISERLNFMLAFIWSKRIFRRIVLDFMFGKFEIQLHVFPNAHMRTELVRRLSLSFVF